MARLSDREFSAMNTCLRRWVQRWWEFPMLKRFQVPVAGRDVLEIGCGSGFGAQLLLSLQPRSYTGLDFMPEQVALARKHMPGTEFFVQDASAMKDVASATRDTVVVFGVLHHIPEWKAAMAEIARVLRPGGEVYLEEPDGGVIGWFDQVFKWGHPVTFRLRELEAQARAAGFKLARRSYFAGFGFYRLQKA